MDCSIIISPNPYKAAGEFLRLLFHFCLQANYLAIAASKCYTSTNEKNQENYAFYGETETLMQTEHKNKSQTKTILYESAKALFYEKGYTATSVRDIVNRANSKLGLFTYYFESKDALAVKIFNEYAASVKQAIRRVVERHYPDIYDDYLFVEMFEYRCSQYLYILDPQTASFFSDIMSLQRFINRRSQEKVFYFNQFMENAALEKLNPNCRNKGYADIALALAEGMELFFCRKLCNNTLSVPIDDALDILFQSYYAFFLSDKKQINDMIKTTRQVLAHLQFTPTGPFQVNVAYRDTTR